MWIPPCTRAIAARAAIALSLATASAGCSSGRSTCPGAPATTDARAATADVARVLDDWHDAAAKANEERYFSHFGKGAVFLGTDAKERWTLPDFRAYAHPHFAKGKAWSFRATRREITVVGDTAWFDEDLDTPNLGPARGTGVLVREDGAWKIVQYDLSVPIPNERFKEVKALIEAGR